MRTREPEGPLDPQIAADLDGVDRVLGGRPADPADAGLTELATLLRDERPVADQQWADGLDERAAAGFPRGGGRGPQGPKARRRSSFFGAGGWMVPAGAVATLAVVVVVATSNLGGDDRNDSTSMPSSDQAVSSSPAAPSAGHAPQFDANGEIAPVTAAPSESADTDASGVAGELAYPSELRAMTRDSGKIAPGTENRKVDRSTQLTLSARMNTFDL